LYLITSCCHALLLLPLCPVLLQQGNMMGGMGGMGMGMGNMGMGMGNMVSCHSRLRQHSLGLQKYLLQAANIGPAVCVGTHACLCC
jgi:hypothetical protein